MNLSYSINIPDETNYSTYKGTINSTSIEEAVTTIIRKHSDLLCKVMTKLTDNTPEINIKEITDGWKATVSLAGQEDTTLTINRD